VGGVLYKYEDSSWILLWSFTRLCIFYNLTHLQEKGAYSFLGLGGFGGFIFLINYLLPELKEG
jgi:hypothetical protein